MSAAALRPLATALEHSQRMVAAAIAEHSLAYPRAVALGTARAEAEQSADPAQRATALAYRCREVAELERAQVAERSHLEAWRQFHEADRRCAAVLHQLVEDGLADSRTYDALSALGRAAGQVEDLAGPIALLPTPPTKALGVAAGAAGAVNVLTETTLKVAYGDGDWTSIGLWAAATAAGPASKVLKRGALATNPAARSAATRTERRLLRHGLGERLRLGALGELRQVGRSEAKRPVPPFLPTRAPRSPIAAAHWAREQLAERVRYAVRVKWLDDLALATGDPARSRSMLLAGFGGEAAAAAFDGAGAVRDLQLDRQQATAGRARDERYGADGPGGPRRPR